MDTPLNLPICIANSPIAFVVTAQVGGRDTVIIRTNDAPLDLLGVVAGGYDTMETAIANTVFADLFFGVSRQLNVVAGYPVSDLLLDSDTRTSSMKFAWVGECSEYRRNRVLESFRTASAEILRSVKSGDPSAIEWALGDVLLQCSLANQRKAQRRRTLTTVTIIYAIAALFALTFVLTRYFLKFS